MAAKRKPETDPELQSAAKKSKREDSLPLNANTWCHISSFLEVKEHALLGRTSRQFRLNSKRPISWCPEVVTTVGPHRSAQTFFDFGLRNLKSYSTDTFADAESAALLFNSSLRELLAVEEAPHTTAQITGDLGQIFKHAPNLKMLGVELYDTIDRWLPPLSVETLGETHPNLERFVAQPVDCSKFPTFNHLWWLVLGTDVNKLRFTGILPNLRRLELTDRMPRIETETKNREGVILNADNFPLLSTLKFSADRELSADIQDRFRRFQLFNSKLADRLIFLDIRLPPERIYGSWNILTGSTQHFSQLWCLHVENTFLHGLLLMPSLRFSANIKLIASNDERICDRLLFYGLDHYESIDVPTLADMRAHTDRLEDGKYPPTPTIVIFPRP